MGNPAARMVGCSIQVSPYDKRLQDDALQLTLLSRFGFQEFPKHNVNIANSKDLIFVIFPKLILFL
jgi:hypothetical protein